MNTNYSFNRHEGSDPRYNNSVSRSEPFSEQVGNDKTTPNKVSDTAVHLLNRLQPDFLPHPGQARYLAAQFPSQAEQVPPEAITLVCGRRWGKTRLLALDTLTQLLLYPDLQQHIVAPTLDQARLLFGIVAAQVRRPEFATLCAEYGVKELEAPLGEPTIREKRGRLSRVVAHGIGGSGAPNGFALRGLGATPEMPRLRVIIDERGFVPDRVVEDAIKPMFATVSADMGQLVQAGTPWGSGAFRRDFESGRRDTSGRHLALHGPTAENPLVSAQFLSDQRNTLPAASFACEYLAEWPVSDISPVTLLSEEEISRALVPDDYGTRPRISARYAAGIAWRPGTLSIAVLDVACRPARLVALHHIEAASAPIMERVAKLCAILSAWRVTYACASPSETGVALWPHLCECLRGVCPKLILETSRLEQIETLSSISIAVARGLAVFPPYAELLRPLRQTNHLPETTTLHPVVAAFANALEAALPCLARYAQPDIPARRESLAPAVVRPRTRDLPFGKQSAPLGLLALSSDAAKRSLNTSCVFPASTDSSETPTTHARHIAAQNPYARILPTGASKPRAARPSLTFSPSARDVPPADLSPNH